MSDNKKYDSHVCINGKRISQMRAIAEAVFEESLLSIEVNEHGRQFIIRIDDTKAHKKQKFQQEHKQCKVIVYKEIDFSSL